MSEISHTDKAQRSGNASANNVSVVPSGIVSMARGDSFTDERGRTWASLTAATEHFHCNAKFRRQIRSWISTKKVLGVQDGEGGRAPYYVDIDSLRTYLDMRYKVPSVDPQDPESEIPALMKLQEGLAADGYLADVEDTKELEVASTPPALVASMVEQIREMNDDWREVLSEQLEDERNRRTELEQENINLRVELELKRQAELALAMREQNDDEEIDLRNEQDEMERERGMLRRALDFMGLG